MNIGDKTKERIYALNCKNPRLYTGTVVYIHPKYRYYRVRFDFPYGSFCESFLMGDRR